MSDAADSRLSALFTGGTILFFGLVVQLGINFLAKLVIARFLGRTDFGAVALGSTLLTSVGVVILVGTDTGIGRYLPRYEGVEQRRGVLVSAFQIVLPVSLVASGIMYFAAAPIARHIFTDPSVAPVVRIFSFALPLLAVVKLTIGSVRGMQESTPRVYLQNFALPLSRFVLIAGAVAAGFRAVGVAWAYTLSYGLVAALSVAYLFYRTPLFESTATDPMYRELLYFSTPLMITSTMAILFSNVDTFIIGFFTTTGEVGVYNVAYPLAALLSIILNAFSFIFMPAISELHSDGSTEEMRRTFEIVSKWILIATLPLFFVIFSYPNLVIKTTFGAEYVSGSLTLSVLAVGFLTHSIAGPAGNTLTAIGLPRRVMYTNVVVVLVNIALNFYLIPRYGIVGAAVATTVGYVLMNGLFLVQLYHETGIHPFRRALLRPTAAAILLWACLYVGSWSLPRTLPVVLLLVAVFGILYLVTVVRFGGVEREEMMLLARFESELEIDLSPIRRVARRLME